MKYKLWLTVLTVLVTVSLALNGVLIFALAKARAATLDTLASVRNSLAVMGSESLNTTIHVDQNIPLNTIVPVSETITIPLDFVYPLSTVVNTYVNLPVLGRQDIAVPIDTLIPIQYDLTVPIDVNFPISLTYRLQVEVPVSFDIPAEIRAPLDQFLEQTESALR